MTCSLVNYLSNQSADSWVAVWTFALFLATIALAVIAYTQIHSFRRDQKAWESIKACERYDTDAILNAGLLQIKAARDAGTLQTAPLPLSVAITSVMNYLEAVAIGVQDGFYDECIVRAHLEPIMREHVEEFQTPAIKKALKSDGCWDSLEQVLEEWTKRPYKRFRL